MKFDYARDFKKIDFRRHPELYQVGRGEQGVLLVEPYRSELLPLWRFRTPEVARESAGALYEQFLRYRAAGDFVGMDMARKYLQMGWTRARRYANHKGGRKYAADGKTVLPRAPDPVKARAAAIFREKWRLVQDDPEYLRLKQRHREQYDSGRRSETGPRRRKTP
jgi:hypothetical protein